MKKLVFLFFTLLTLCSCEKPYVGEDDMTSEQQGNLMVSVFQLEQTPFSAISRAPATETCTRLNFAVYQLDGTRVKQTNQQLSDAGFGATSFTLEAGTYQLVVVAHSSNGNPTMTNPAKIQFTNAQGFSDTFLYCDEVTISNDPVSLSLTLNRIVSLCRFVITDDYPEDVAKMRFTYTGGSGTFDAATGFGSVKSTQTLTFDIASNQKQYDLYSFPYASTECTIHLKTDALDAAENILFEREFDIPLTRNKITWFSGPYFIGGSESADVSVDINNAWEDEIHLTY